MKKLFIFLVIVLSGMQAAQAQQWGMYTLYATMNGTSAYLIDTNSNVYHSWTFPSTAKTGYSTYLLEGGTLLRSVSRTGNSFFGGPICGEVQKVDWDGNVTWDYIYSTTDYCTHHDVCPMPNGNVLLIAYERKSATDVTAAGCTFNGEMWPDKIVEVQPTGATTGTVVWEWHAWDHLVQNVDANKSNYQASISAHPELLNINYNSAKDWMHMNGVNYNAQLDQIAFSCHNLSEIYIIDHSTTMTQAAGHTGGNAGKGGDILYRWGNPAAYGTGTTTDQVLKVVHDAHWVPQGCPKAGYLVGFNNNGISNNQSCVDMINPPLSGNNYTITTGSAYLPASYNYRHSANGHTSNMGNSQQLPNGNMLVCIALSGYIYEIDSNNTVLWSKTVSGQVPKAFRYSACYVTGNPDTPSITQSANTLTSSAAAGNQWYLNGNPITGANAQSYTATQSGAYTVKVTDTNGCVSVLSDVLNVTVTAIDQITVEDNVVFYPNPTTGMISMKHSGAGADYTISVFDVQGKLLLQLRNAKTIDLSMYGSGMYYLSLRTDRSVTTEKISLIR